MHSFARTLIQRRPAAEYALLLGVLVLCAPFIAQSFYETVGHSILSMIGVLTGFGGMLLNYTVVNLGVEMGQTIEGQGIEVTIQTIWSVIRDLCNIVFVFGLIFIGFQTILNVETINTKKSLIAIVVGALLINFSLFFSQLIIDVSNVFTAEIYELAQIPDADDTFTYGIAGSFMSAMGLNTFWAGVGFGDITAYDVTFGGNIAYFFMAIIFLLIAAVVFAAGAIFLVIRFAALILIMIFSPIMFAGMVFPQTQGMAFDLWKKLISYSFFAPIYLFLLYISLQVLNQTRGAFSGDFGNLFTGDVGAFPIVVNFTIASILLIASVIIAKNLSIAGAERVNSAVKTTLTSPLRASKWAARSSAMGTARFAGRYASRGVRRFEQGTKDTALGRLGRSGGGEFLKKIPLIRPGLQKAGGYAKSEVEKGQKELGKRRTGEIKRMLADPIRKLTPTKRLEAFRAMHLEKGDADEMTPEWVRQYYSDLQSFGLSTQQIEKDRPDALTKMLKDENPDQTRPVMRMKYASDGTLHPVNSRLEGEGTGVDTESQMMSKLSANASEAEIAAAKKARNEKRAARKEELDVLWRDQVRNLPADTLSAILRRRDANGEAARRALLQDMKDEGVVKSGVTEIPDAPTVVEYYKKIAEGTPGDAKDGSPEEHGFTDRRLSNATYFASIPGARMAGLQTEKQSQAEQSKPQPKRSGKGGRAQRARKQSQGGTNRGDQGDEHDDYEVEMEEEENNTEE